MLSFSQARHRVDTWGPCSAYLLLGARLWRRQQRQWWGRRLLESHWRVDVDDRRRHHVERGQHQRGPDLRQLQRRFHRQRRLRARRAGLRRRLPDPAVIHHPLRLRLRRTRLRLRHRLRLLHRRPVTVLHQLRPRQQVDLQRSHRDPVPDRLVLHPGLRQARDLRLLSLSSIAPPGWVRARERCVPPAIGLQNSECRRTRRCHLSTGGSRVRRRTSGPPGNGL